MHIFYPVSWTTHSGHTYMLAGTLGAPIYFIPVGWIAHSSCTYMSAGMLGVPIVKNGFSNPTKAQEGRDRPRKDVMNRCRGKALSEGCRERKKTRMVVSSREKINNNKNLVRATTKSKSKMQTVSNGHVSRGARDKGFEERPNVGDLVE